MEGFSKVSPPALSPHFPCVSNLACGEWMCGTSHLLNELVDLCSTRCLHCIGATLCLFSIPFDSRMGPCYLCHVRSSCFHGKHWYRCRWTPDVLCMLVSPSSTCNSSPPLAIQADLSHPSLVQLHIGHCHSTDNQAAGLL